MKLHTLEFIKRIDYLEYEQCRDFFFTTAKGMPYAMCYEDKRAYRIRYNRWKDSGVIIHLQEATHNFPAYYLYLRVNPSKVLGESDPIALFSPSPENVASLADALDEILSALPFQIDSQQVSLYRVDLTQDRIVDNEEAVSSYMRLLEKGASTDRWKTDTFNDAEKDLHSFRRSNDRYQITVYDKLFQIEQCGSSTAWDGSGRILRVETALLTAGIQHLQSKGWLPSTDAWPSLLVYLNEHGKVIMRKILKRLIQPGDYYSLRQAAGILSSRLSRAKSEKLIEFLREINRPSKVDAPTIKKHKNGKKRLRQLAELNVNPVTIDVRAACSSLPSLFPEP